MNFLEGLPFRPPDLPTKQVPEMMIVTAVYEKGDCQKGWLEFLLRPALRLFRRIDPVRNVAKQSGVIGLRILDIGHRESGQLPAN